MLLIFDLRIRKECFGNGRTMQTGLSFWSSTGWSRANGTV